jgi:hypothetical protein
MPSRIPRIAPLVLAVLGLVCDVMAQAAPSPQGILRGLWKRARKPKAAVVDTLPPRWRPAPLVALDDSLLELRVPALGPTGTALRVAADPRQLRVQVEPDSGTLSYGVVAGEVPVTPAARAPLAAYSQDLTRANFQRLWQQQARERISQQAGTTTVRRTTGIQIAAPFELPRRVQSLLGPGGPALNVSGSERISLAGTSDWSNRPTVLGQRRSLFPSLDMRQDLDIRLEGQLSDRVKVNLLQSSANQIPLANRIAINYQGDEEDVVQALNLGNTNLSLPGTQYVSYSGRNEGLFGAKTALRLGPLDFTVLASKQEGRSERASYTGGSTSEEIQIADYDYIRGTYFFLDYPDNGGADIPDYSVRVFVDDRIGGNSPNSRPGRAYLDPTSGDTTSVRGVFDQLVPTTDYQIQQPYGPFFKVIHLSRAVQEHQVVAVVYRDSTRSRSVGGQVEDDSVLVMKLLKAPATLLPPDSTGRFDTRVPLARSRDLELRNFYDLGGTRIDPQSLQLRIRRGTDEPPVTTFRLPDERAVSYLQMAGLDNLDETSTPRPGHDDQVDRGFVSNDPSFQRSGAFVDYENGILFFPDLRPFAPRTAVAGSPDTSAFEGLVDRLLLRDARFAYGDDSLGNSANWRIYDLRSPSRLQDSRYFIVGEYAASGVKSNIRLNRTNIVEGSETVAINGEALRRGIDYDIDYDLGEVRLKRQVGPSDRLSVDFTYAPLFAQASRTLVGSALTLQGRDRSMGGAFLYESRGAQELRPRLGEEPSRTFIGDLNTDLRFKPDWLTRLVDRLPGLRTTEPSSFNVNAEMGMSLPNPNTRNEVYIDDMEGVRDAVSLTMGYERWRWSSIPPVRDCPSCSEAPIQGRMKNAEVRWFTPINPVKERDLKPRLSKAEGAENSRQVLAISVPRRPAGALPTDSLWAGLTYPLDLNGYDLSGAQFIELWVNDFRDFQRIRDPQVRLHVDVGRVSEDQMRSPDRLPNRLLDTEDTNRDDQLNEGEDVGIDRAPNGQEPVRLDLSTATDQDLSGDDWAGPTTSVTNELDPRRWQRVNGSEGNAQATANPYPDTEDLDGNDILDELEGFVRYTVDLGEDKSPFLVTDVYREYRGKVAAENEPREDNGWRLYRIPLADPSRESFGLVDLKFTKQVRVWLEGLTETDPDPNLIPRPLLVLGGLEIVGSRWVASGLDSLARAAGTALTLTSVNTVDNADIYQAPFDPGTTTSGSQALKRREQSLAVQFENLPSGGKVEAYRSFSLDEDYSRYRQLRWWVTGAGDSANGLQYYVRFGADSINFYEYRAPVPPVPPGGSLAWHEVRLQLTDLSNLKLAADYHAGLTYVAPGLAPGDTFVLVGRPSFTRVRRITFGVRNPQGATVPAGQVWLDEIRASDIIKDVGIAQRVAVTGRLANLMSYNFSQNGEDEDFLRLGQTRGSGSAANQFGGSATIDVHRFVEGTGLQLPVTLGYSRSTRRPRFAVGDDIRRTGEAQDRSSSFGESRSFGLRAQRTWSEHSNPFLRYTLGGLSASYNWQQNASRSPTSIDTNRASNLAVNYSISPRQLFSLGVPIIKQRFYPLPERFYWNYTVNNNQASGYERDQSGSGALSLRTRTQGRAARVDFGMDSRPVEAFRHHFEATRNLSLAPNLMEKVGFINFGKVVSWRQNMDGQFRMNRGVWLAPTFGWSGTYNQNNGPEISPDLSLRAVNNGQGANVGWELPFDRLRHGPAAPVTADTGAAKHRPPVDWLGESVGRLGSVQTDLSFNRTSSYSRLRGTPSFLYLLGLSSQPGLGGPVDAVFGNQGAISTNWRTGFHHRVALVYGMAAQSSFEFNSRQDQVNGARSKSNNMRFPNLDVDYGLLARGIRLDRWFRDPRLRTRFQRSTQTDFATGDRVTARSSSSAWTPLMEFNGNLKNNTRTQFKVERNVTRRENLLFGQSVTTDRTTDVNLNLTRSYESGQKVKFLGKESLLKGNVTLTLAGVYSRRSGETLTTGVPVPQQVIASDRLSLNGSGSYSFSTNLSGQASLGFGQNRDLRVKSRPVVNRSVRVELSATFNF